MFSKIKRKYGKIPVSQTKYVWEDERQSEQNKDREKENE